MDRPVLLVTYSRLTITELEAKNIISDVYPEVHAVVDAVEAFSGGKEMREKIIYHFNGMGVSAMISPPEIELEGEPSPAHQEAGGDIAVQEAEAISDSRPEILASRPFVTSVCKSDVIVSTARRTTDLVDADPSDEAQWNLNTINVNGDTASKFSGKGVKIAILDTGIADHDDLKNVNGGVSFCENKEDYRCDDFGHGTHCAGIAAGTKGGIAKGAELYSIKVADETGAKPVAILAGLGWALRNRMNVVSISMAGPADLNHIPAFANAVQALMKINCVVVASTGDSKTDVGLPANTPGIIAVGGCDEHNVLLADTNIGSKGNHMTVVAPATGITTTSRANNGYVRMFDGSSAAAPHVAGLVALIHEKFPGITPLQVIGRIQASAQPVNIRRNRRQGALFGALLIDCDAALALF